MVQAFRNYSWMETELNSKVVRSDEPPNSGGQIDMRHDKSILELP